MIHEHILKEHQHICHRVDALKKQLLHFPDGKLICCHHGKRRKWYHSNGHGRIYIPQSNRPLAEQLAIKKYLTCQLNDLSREQIALEAYLRHYRPTNTADQLLQEIPGYQELLSPFFKPVSEELKEWAEAAFEQNTFFPEHLIHKTSSGQLVRSKSEAMIVHLLYTNKIPFRYECALELGSATIYPDFTIRHPQTGEWFYWEHFGMMDDEEYCKNAICKLQLYCANNIIPSINLITTYETKNAPLSMEIIQKTVEHYFLSSWK